MNKPNEVEVGVTDDFSTIELTDARPPPPPRSSFLTRVGSFIVLFGAVAGVGYVLYSAFFAVTDAFIAPIILSPDNDIVLAHRQKVMELESQLALAQANAEGVDADLAAMETAEQRLLELQKLVGSALSFTTEVNSQQASAGEVDLVTLSEQRTLLQSMHARQREATDRAKRNYDAGLITQSDYDKELQSLHQAELALLENSRARSRSQAAMSQVLLSKSSLAGRGAPIMPEAMQRESQIVQLQLELLRLHAERRAKTAERRVLSEKISAVTDLHAQLKSRPISLAIGRSLYVAFVPYTQMESVQVGAAVLRCVWGVFHCSRAGSVAEIVPGEVTAPDPWGNPARGRYILLDLQDPTAATAKVLRVRRPLLLKERP